jgi:hypothetical protein
MRAVLPRTSEAITTVDDQHTDIYRQHPFLREIVRILQWIPAGVALTRITNDSSPC